MKQKKYLLFSFLAFLYLSCPAVWAQTEIPAGGNVAASINAGNTDIKLTGDAVWNNQLTISNGSLSIDGYMDDSTNYKITVPSNLLMIRTFSANNAVINFTNIDFTRSAAVPNSNEYLIGFDSAVNLRLNLEGSSFKNFGTTRYRGSAVLFAYADNQTITIDGGAKGVLFADNRAQDDAAGVLAVSYADVIFEGKVDFTNNWTGNYGGAITVYDFANSLTFNGTTTFTGNHSSVFGGAINVWGNTGSVVTFNGTTSFIGNYTNLTGNDSNTPNHVTDQHTRGGALNIGYVGGANSQATVIFNGAVTFDGNHAISQISGRNALGGAISVYGNNEARRYRLSLNGPATFTNNYAYSVSGLGHGGAIFFDAQSSNASQRSELNISSNSLFENNYAKTYGGAIYLQQGDINLNALNGNGDITFQGNRHGATFSPSGATFAPDNGSGTPNAICLGSSGNLTFNADLGQAIRFYDPIASAAGATITVTKTGAGEVIFYGNNTANDDYVSDVRGNTIVQGGAFSISDQAVYGNVSQGTFTVQNSGMVQGGGNSTLRSQALTVQTGGALGAAGGVFNVNSGSISIQAGAYFRGNGSIIATSAINLAGQVTADIVAGNTLAINSVMAGAGGITKTNAGTFTLNAVNTYTGAAGINSGTLSAGTANVFAQSSGVTLATGAVFNLNGNNQSVRNFGGGGTVNLGAGALTVNNAGATVFSGIINGSGGLTKTGS